MTDGPKPSFATQLVLRAIGLDQRHLSPIKGSLRLPRPHRRRELSAWWRGWGSSAPSHA